MGRPTEMLSPYLLPFAGLISLLVECLTFPLRTVTFYLGHRKSFFWRVGGFKSDLTFCMYFFLLSAEMLYPPRPPNLLPPPSRIVNCWMLGIFKSNYLARS